MPEFINIPKGNFLKSNPTTLTHCLQTLGGFSLTGDPHSQISKYERVLYLGKMKGYRASRSGDPLPEMDAFACYLADSVFPTIWLGVKGDEF